MNLNGDVLSLFNGASILNKSLDKLGVNYDKYYYSEVDKWANKLTQHHFPNALPLGDVLNWRDWDIDWSGVQLIGAGFPCNSWSVAGKQLGDKDERGKLFWTTLDIIAHAKLHNPNVKFLIENVKMKGDFERYITHHTNEALGDVEKVLINSSTLLPQNRERYYWTNFKVVQPTPRDMCIRDILEDRDDYTYRPCERIKDGNVGHIATATDIKGMDCIKRVYGVDGKSPTLTTMGGGHREPKWLISEGMYRKASCLELERCQGWDDNYTSILSDTQRKKIIGNGWSLGVITHIISCMFTNLNK